MTPLWESFLFVGSRHHFFRDNTSLSGGRKWKMAFFCDWKGLSIDKKTLVGYCVKKVVLPQTQERRT